jgi:hypothetical protein
MKGKTEKCLMSISSCFTVELDRHQLIILKNNREEKLEAMLLTINKILKVN